MNVLRTAVLGVLIMSTVIMAGVPVAGRAEKSLEAGFENPPREARLRAFWWWLNGNVTAEAITRDLEEMAAKGFGGALICDGGGAEQDGNEQVPHGPTFLTPEWLELYKHTLREADRLGLEMGLNIQSGWNLGGPMVKAEDAPKRLVWSQTRVSGPGHQTMSLAKPRHAAALYRDVAVLAYPAAAIDQTGVAITAATASSDQPGHLAPLAIDDHADSFWVSKGKKPGEGPTRQRPEWIQVELDAPVCVQAIRIQGRPGYGPRECTLQASDDGKTWRNLKSMTVPQDGDHVAEFAPTVSSRFRLMIFSAFDPHHPDAPRNVQIAELKLLDAAQALAAAGPRARLTGWEYKAMHRALHSSAPDTTPLLEETPDEPGEEHLRAQDVVDLTHRMSSEGALAWDVPEGEWEILRVGYTLNQHCRVSTCSEGWNGYALDPFDANALRSYWKAVVDRLIAEAGPLAGRVLKYLHTDSWEVEVANWTPGLREEFRKRRGYDLMPFLPTIAGRIVDSRSASNRFLHDFRRTMGDLAIDNHYRIFSEEAHRHGLHIHPESGGPHAVPIDSLQCLGMNDAPMSEFWARSWRHRVKDEQRFFVKQPASASHTYGRGLVLAEGFTTIGPHWQETLWDNLKPSFDRAICEGLNLLVWHGFTCSPKEMGLPGQEYFAGTHFNPNATWWSRSAPFLAYINRCQYLMQRGLFVADAVYYYGDQVPNFAQLRASDPARLQFGYDYDVATEEVVLTRMNVRDGRIVLPDGMSYRVLVLPDQPAISLPVLRKLRELVAAGATVIGPKPQRATSLQDREASDAEVRQIAEELWGDCDGKSVVEHRTGKGRVVCGRTAREVLMADGVPPDFEVASLVTATSKPDASPPATVLNYIHRQDGEADIFFVCNARGEQVSAEARFRVSGKAPELWDPLTGKRRGLGVYAEADGRTTVPLAFAPYGSWFVVFRKPAVGADPLPRRNFPTFTRVGKLGGPWTVRFDPQWGGPASARFDQLVSWTRRPEEGIRFYSGTATYEKEFEVAPTLLGDRATRTWLDLGRVCQLAEVRVNGKNLGVVWAMPFRVDVTDALQPGANRLEVDVVSFWPNRVIGDAGLPPEQRRTRTNIRKLTADTPLVESGLLGPVTLQSERW